MKDIRVTLSQDVKNIDVILLGDIHRGSAQFDEPLFNKVIKYISENENCYTVLMGDLIDNALKNSKSNIYCAVESPKDSIDWIVNKLKSIKHKILALTSGNHEDRTSREAGIDITANIAERLDLTERYSEGPFILYVSLGTSRNRKGMYQTFTIFGTHGSGGGSSQSGALNKILSLANIVPNADIYLMGHTHKPLITFENRYLINSVARTHVEHEALYVNGGSFLNFEGSYGEKNLYKPTSKKVPIINLKTGYDYKKVEVSIL